MERNVARRWPSCFECRVVRANRTPGNIPLIVLVVANLLPVVGVLFRDWSVFEIVALYWFENVVIGAFNALKMLTAAGDMFQGKPVTNPKEAPDMPSHLRTPVATGPINQGIKVFLIPFFTIHYGLFCLVHGLFVFSLLGGRGGGMMSGNPITGIGRMIWQVFDSGGKWFIVAIIGSHLFSFLYNYIGKGEFRRISAPELMMSPYGRIVVLHIAIILGAFVITALGSPVFLLLLLIAGKIALDGKLHLRSHGKFRSETTES